MDHASRGSRATEQDEWEQVAWDEGTLGAHGHITHSFRRDVQPPPDSSDLSPYDHLAAFLPESTRFQAMEGFSTIVSRSIDVFSTIVARGLLFS